MIEQIVHKHNTSAAHPTLLDDYIEAEAEMRALHDGGALRKAVDIVLSQLPSGHVTLLATSPEGVGLAAAAAARRRETTMWQPLDARLGVQHVLVGRAVVVEPVDPGPGWRSLIEQAVPDARFVFARDDVERIAA